MADGSLTLYQTEWCPFSSAVREALTELGLTFTARQVEPWPEQREELRRVAGTDQIPVLRAEDGGVHLGTRAIFAYLRERDAWNNAAAHRRRFADHRDARESDAPGQLIEYFRGTDELEAGEGTAAETEVATAAATASRSRTPRWTSPARDGASGAVSPPQHSTTRGTRVSRSLPSAPSSRTTSRAIPSTSSSSLPAIATADPRS